MALSIYDVTVPVFNKMLPALKHVLEQGEADAEARGIDPSVYLQGRLAPDMFALTRQVQIVTDQVKGGLSRLAGMDVPSWPDDEASFAELYARIDKTTDYAQSFGRDAFEGAETRTIELKFPQAEFKFNGLDYVNHFLLPNLYFHTTATYAILRHNGVKIGKKDFFGG